MKKNDETVAERVISGIRDELNIAANDVNVSVLDGVVELSGFVDVLAEKQDVERITSETDGVRKVINDITIAMDGSISDKEIQNSVNEILNLTLVEGNPIGVNSKVVDGNAILEGRVNNQTERKAALREASKVFGVKNVVNHIEVAPKNNRVDIRNNLFNRISSNTINTQYVNAVVHNGKVVLDGYVKNKKEQEALMNIAEGIEGVHKVVSHLTQNPSLH